MTNRGAERRMTNRGAERRMTSRGAERRMTSAADLVESVLRWAMAPAGAPPLGEAFGLAELLSPSVALGEALAVLAATTAARCALAPPAFDTSPGPGAGAIWMAAAVALRARPELADELLRGIPPPPSDWPRGGWDLIARHGLTKAALHYLPPALAEPMLSASPLTALLLSPARGEEDRTLVFCQTLLAAPASRQPVVAAFADPAASAEQLSWRAEVLTRLASAADRSGHAFALDVYETAVAWHSDAWLLRVREGGAILRSRHPSGPADKAGQPAPDASRQAWQRAVAIGRWWQPLLMLRRRNMEAIRKRGYLDFRIYWSGLQLAAVTENLHQG